MISNDDFAQAARDDTILKAIGKAALSAFLEAQDNPGDAWRDFQSEIERILKVAAHAYHMPLRED